MSFLEKLKALDAYPKVISDVREYTRIGGFVTIFSSLLIMWLVLNEFSEYRATEEVHHISVDTRRTLEQTMKINLDMSIAMPCDMFSADVQDLSGQSLPDVEHTLQRRPALIKVVPPPDKVNSFYREDASNLDWTFKHVMKKSGKAEENFVQARLAALLNRMPERIDGMPESKPVVLVKTEKNATEALKKAEENKDAPAPPVETQNPEYNGCRVFGTITVSKLKGNFHIAGGRSVKSGDGHVHDFRGISLDKLNFTHAIHRMSFGNDFPGLKNPLDTLVQHTTYSTQMYQYFIQVVPTVFANDAHDRVIDTNQYSVTLNGRVIDHDKGQHGLPGLFFNFDLAPVRVDVTQTSGRIGHFIVRLCAIVGGAFAVSGMVNQFLSSVNKTVTKKTNARSGTARSGLFQ